MLGFKHFQEKAHKAENNQNKQKIDEKMQVLWDIDFEGILNGFWEGLGRPKSMIFAFFREKMEAKNKMIFGRLKNRVLRPQSGISLNFWAGWAVCAGPGEGTKGWGKALEVGI